MPNGRSARTHKILRELVALNGRLSTQYHIHDLAMHEPDIAATLQAMLKPIYHDRESLP